MTKVIVFTQPDGEVRVIHISPQYIKEVFNGNEDDAIAAEMAKTDVVPINAMRVEVMDKSLLPPSHSTRNAWRRPGLGPPTVDPMALRIFKEASPLKVRELIDFLKSSGVINDSDISTIKKTR